MQNDLERGQALRENRERIAADNAIKAGTGKNLYVIPELSALLFAESLARFGKDLMI